MAGGRVSALPNMAGRRRAARRPPQHGGRTSAAAVGGQVVAPAPSLPARSLPAVPAAAGRGRSAPQRDGDGAGERAAARGGAALLRGAGGAGAAGGARRALPLRGEPLQHDLHVRVPRVPGEPGEGSPQGRGGAAATGGREPGGTQRRRWAEGRRPRREP